MAEIQQHFPPFFLSSPDPQHPPEQDKPVNFLSSASINPAQNPFLGVLFFLFVSLIFCPFPVCRQEPPSLSWAGVSPGAYCFFSLLC
jgi:hypothetical protein